MNRILIMAMGALPRFSRRLVGLICCCLAVLSCYVFPQTAIAETIYNTFRNDGGFAKNSGYFVRANEPEGAEFVVPATNSVRLESITLAVQATDWGGAGLANIRVTLRESTNTNDPGLILDAIERNDIAMSPPTYAAATYLFSSVSKPMLEAGRAYWIVVENIGIASGYPFWFANVLDLADPVVELQGGSWYHYNPVSASSPAVRVDVAAVPEPSTLALLVSALLSLVLIDRGRRKCTVKGVK